MDAVVFLVVVGAMGYFFWVKKGKEMYDSYKDKK